MIYYSKSKQRKLYMVGERFAYYPINGDQKKESESLSNEEATQQIKEALSELFVEKNISIQEQTIMTEIVLTIINKFNPETFSLIQIKNFIAGFLPALVEKRACLTGFFDGAVFIKGFDADQNEISVNDFIVQCLTRECNSVNLTMLTHRLRQMPAIDNQRISQNRKDARILGSIGLNALREMIHDQKSAAYPMIKAMINFYETKDSRDLVSQITKWKQMYPEDDLSLCLQPNTYNLSAQDYGETQTEKIISILYRLKENLSFIGSLPPTTPNEYLNQALVEANRDIERAPHIQDLERCNKSLIIINSILIESIQKKAIGIDPSYIATIGWLRHRLGKNLSSISQSTASVLVCDDLLTEILRLMEITANCDDYSHQEFSSFVRNYKNSSSFEEAAKKIFDHTNTRVSKTHRQLKKIALSSYQFGGNLTTEELNNPRFIVRETIEKELESLANHPFISL